MPFEGQVAKHEATLAPEPWDPTTGWLGLLPLLARAGRRPMPKGHRWDFHTILRRADNGLSIYHCDPVPECGTVGCKIGLAHVLYGGAAEQALGRFAQHDPINYACIFSGFNSAPLFSAITPAMVSSAIDEYLTTGAFAGYGR